MKIDRANATMVGVIATASFLVIFTLVASNQLLSQQGYQSRVIDEKVKANTQLESDLKTAKNLATSYTNFVTSNEYSNIIGGDPKGKNEKDGDNARLILDALPSKYDLPALTSTIEKITVGQNSLLSEIEATDDEVNQEKQAGSNKPEPVDMFFKIEVLGSYDAMQQIIGQFESSIRPLSIQKLEFEGGDTTMKMKLDGKTFYLPEKTLDIKSKVVK